MTPNEAFKEAAKAANEILEKEYGSVNYAIFKEIHEKRLDLIGKILKEAAKSYID